ncbi:protein unc-45 homolog B-like [Liolophura sinensis]|uniref:protein unc-45 homolog B-like n=1 Tax=Liolophura sinensis TaxID=3198878 RepID=UPI0031595C98
MDAKQLREDGNALFKDGKFEEALALYTKAINISPLKESEKSAIYKNKAACELKLERYSEAVDDASKALEISPDDPKALFRRSQAYEKLGKVEEAYKDAVHLVKVEPKNTAVKPIINRLGPIIQEKIKEQNSTASKVTQMFNLAFDSSIQDREKRLQAANNLVVLAKDEAGANKIMQENGVEKLIQMAVEKDTELVQTAVRALACLAEKNRTRAEIILTKVGLRNLCALIGQANEGVSTAASTLLQNVLTAVSGFHIHQEKMEKWEEQKRQGGREPRPQFRMDEETQKLVDEIFQALTKMLIHGKVSAIGRDSAMELIIRNIPRLTNIGWTRQFLESDGISHLLTIAGTFKHDKTLAVTDKSRMHASLALSKIFEDTVSDRERDIFKEKCTNFLKELFAETTMESKLEAMETISTLLQGPNEVGQMMLGISGVTEIMILLLKSENPLYQKVAVETVVHSATKKDKCTGILKDVVPVLKTIYQTTSDDHVKVRALVGMCKLGSAGGTDASSKPMADGSTLALAKACRRFLTNPTKDIDLRKWATEGLAYLTLDADVKEELIEDADALKSLMELSKGHDKMILYASITVFVNLTNSYDKQDVMPELVELAKFAKQHVPEEHPKDSMEFIKERIQKLAKLGVVSALVSLSTTDSKNSRELIARLFVALATEENLRGNIVQGGGAKALIPLALDNTDNGKVLAAHALAKVAVTMNPEIAFPGQRMLEIVRPLLQLLHPDRSGLQNFEALLALTNLSSVSESVRKRIISEKGFGLIENYMFEDHDEIKRAATECMCNMVMSEEVAAHFKGANDRIKLLVLYAQEAEDLKLVRAAAGALAVLSKEPEICQKIVQVQSWLEMLQGLVVNEQTDIQHRGCHLLMNMMDSGEDVAKKIVETNLLEIMMALSKSDGPEKKPIQQCVNSALETAVNLKLIKPFN